MRVNVYAEELTPRVEIVEKEADGRVHTGLRFYLELPATVDGKQHQGPFMHRPGDDDSSAVTFWGKRSMRELLKKALELLDAHYAERDARDGDRLKGLGYTSAIATKPLPKTDVDAFCIEIPPGGSIGSPSEQADLMSPENGVQIALSGCLVNKCERTIVITVAKEERS